MRLLKTHWDHGLRIREHWRERDAIDADIGYAWVCAEEGTAPPSWTDGQCWALNEDNEPSDPPMWWQPLPPPPKESSDGVSKATKP